MRSQVAERIWVILAGEHRWPLETPAVADERMRTCCLWLANQANRAVGCRNEGQPISKQGVKVTACTRPRYKEEGFGKVTG